MLAKKWVSLNEKCDYDYLLKYVQYDYQNSYEKIDIFSFIRDDETTIDSDIPLIEMEYYTKPNKQTQYLVV